MLNMEYARLVDADRRRVAEERIRTERLLHPDQFPVEIAAVSATENRRPQATCRGVPGPAR